MSNFKIKKHQIESAPRARSFEMNTRVRSKLHRQKKFPIDQNKVSLGGVRSKENMAAKRVCVSVEPPAMKSESRLAGGSTRLHQCRAPGDETSVETTGGLKVFDKKSNFNFLPAPGPFRAAPQTELNPFWFCAHAQSVEGGGGGRSLCRPPTPTLALLSSAVAKLVGPSPMTQNLGHESNADRQNNELLLTFYVYFVVTCCFVALILLRLSQIAAPSCCCVGAEPSH